MGKNDSIPLHPKYGLNPSMDTCPICGEPTTIVLFGANYKEEAPHKVLLSMEPCDTCKEKYLSVGVMCMEGDENRKPTGRLLVLKDEAFKRLFPDTELPKKKICIFEGRLFQEIMKQQEAVHGNHG